MPINTFHPSISMYLMFNKFQDLSKSSSPEVTFTSCVQVKHKEYQTTDDIGTRMHEQINDIDKTKMTTKDLTTIQHEENLELRKFTEYKVLRNNVFGLLSYFSIFKIPHFYTNINFLLFQF